MYVGSSDGSNSSSALSAPSSSANLAVPGTVVTVVVVIPAALVVDADSFSLLSVVFPLVPSCVHNV